MPWSSKVTVKRCGQQQVFTGQDRGWREPRFIEDDVFIGSDTQLVAPVTVGRGATIGAGSTVTKNAPADALTISRSRQTSIEGWKRPKKREDQ